MIELSGLSFAYQPNRPLLTGATLTFEPGCVSAITGPSGRGKSTLLFLAGLLLRPVSGEVLVCGEATTRLPDVDRSRLRNRVIGFVFQDAALDRTQSVLDNVVEPSDYSELPRREARRRAAELMEDLGVDVDFSRVPGQVSGGQAQRIALSRALLLRPRVVLADEPTGNLDPDSSALVLGRLRQESDRGATVVIATHDPTVIGACDRVVPL